MLAALTAIFTLIFKVHRWYLRSEKLMERIRLQEEENTILCFAMAACLDGLIQLGANHTVPKAKDTLDKFLNKKAHYVKEDEHEKS